MNAGLYHELCFYYAPVINQIINEDVRFCNLKEKVEWKFGFNERLAIFAWCDKNRNLLTINIASVNYAFEIGEPLQVEYFLLHELRHIYQNIQIENYKKSPNSCFNPILVEKWIKEKEDYKTVLNEDKGKSEYFGQDIEYDAYVFAYAVMQYKYTQLPEYIKIPKAYGEEFLKSVEERIQELRSIER